MEWRIFLPAIMHNEIDIIFVKNNYIIPCYKWAGLIRKIGKANAQPWPNFTVLAHAVKASSPQGCFFNITPVLTQSRPDTTWERHIKVQWLILRRRPILIEKVDAEIFLICQGGRLSQLKWSPQGKNTHTYTFSNPTKTNLSVIQTWT